jgi:hypothetical protein
MRTTKETSLSLPHLLLLGDCQGEDECLVIEVGSLSLLIHIPLQRNGRWEMAQNQIPGSIYGNGHNDQCPLTAFPDANLHKLSFRIDRRQNFILPFIAALDMY